MPDIAFNLLPPKEAIDFFRKKGYKIGFDWRDTWREEHAYAFTVAKAASLDILRDIRAEVDKALADGTTFADFQKNLRPVLQKKGWWGRKEELDPKTGEIKEVQLGSARRLKTIYDTNIRSAHSAGQWERIQRVKERRPYLRYIAVLDERTRTSHRQWHDVIKPVDDPFWEKFYPPNGWGCRCSVQQLSDRDLKRLGLEVTPTDPSTPDRGWVDKRNGRTLKVPRGIDPGFDYNPGMARMRAMTPPPIDKPLDLPFHGDPAKVPLPVPRSLKADAIWPEDMKDEQYIDRFLKTFGATKTKPVVFTDVTGAPVVISDDLFRTASGKLKLAREDRVHGVRGRYLGLMAQTIKDPDEIWHLWEEYPKEGQWTLLRRYVARYDVAGRAVPAFVLFDVSPKGWFGVTAFPPRRASYIDGQRGGALVWRRPDKK